MKKARDSEPVERVRGRIVERVVVRHVFRPDGTVEVERVAEVKHEGEKLLIRVTPKSLSAHAAVGRFPAMGSASATPDLPSLLNVVERVP